jgi:hypothetical protein
MLVDNKAILHILDYQVSDKSNINIDNGEIFLTSNQK